MNLHTLRHLGEYLALRGVLGACAWLPRRLALGLGVALGELAYRVLRIRRGVVEKNLALTLGQFMDRATLTRIARAHYHHLGRSLIEVARFHRLAPHDLERLVSIHGLEHVDEARAAGRGVVLVTGHTGSWELMAAAVAARGYEVLCIARRQRNPWVDRFLEESRRGLGITLVEPGIEMRRVLRSLAAGGLVGMLADQHAADRRVILDVLGRPAAVQTGPAVLALRTGGAIVNAHVVRERAGYVARFEPPIWPNPEADREREIERLLAACSASLERTILRHPEQWYWVHRRWKVAVSPSDPSLAATGGVG